MVMENGLYLAAMVVTGGMPLLVELGIFFDLLVGVLVMGVITFRINQTFDTISVDRLRRLRH
jgi:hydrogenase-4 component E